MADPNLQQCLTEHAAANGWQYAEQVTRLSCAQRGIASLGGMEQLPNLFVLDVSANALPDLGSLFNSFQLTKLNLSGNRRLRVEEVRMVLDRNQNLTAIGLNGIEVGSFSNLGSLYNWQVGRPYDLTELDLGNTNLTDLNGGKNLDFLLPFQSLSKLNVAGNGIDNIGGLSNTTKLTVLDVSANALVDIGPLFSSTQLTKLNLSGNRRLTIEQVQSVLNQNPNLTALGLNGIQVGSFGNLGPLFNWRTGRPYDLTEMGLGNTNLTDLNGGKSLDFLTLFPNLSRLNVASNGIESISALSNMLKLTALDLSANALVDIGPLFNSTQLTRLNLSGNRRLRIEQVQSVLNQNLNLTSIGLNGIQVGSFGNLGPLFNWQIGRPYDLTELDLGNTNLTDLNGGKSLEFLTPFPNLRKLNVAGNRIDNIGALSNMLKLAVLDLSSNAVVNIFPLTNLFAARLINLLGNNRIRCADLDALKAALPRTVIIPPLRCIAR